ncbi:MAG TPA: cell division protein ZapA [Candidatus Kapabacteria bacterium]|jgi:cell division protein ZapA (FtsZ GTPase activity inhibitor)|nr:cell division protein ZapA [Candidatus Kapabacteria bacterium]
MAQTVKVSILGTDYPLRSNDEQLTRELASDVDAQLKEFQHKLPSQSTTTLAVLTALNFAEQEAQAMQAEIRETERLAEKIDAMSKRLEDAMNG